MSTDNPDIPNIPNSPAVATELASGAARPLVLFPVRLETRFFSLADGNSELRVRVYPDAAHIDTHEPALTPDEVTWGQHFWNQTWRAANDKDRSKAAWRQLAERFGPTRAAWIARALKPQNPAADRPQNPIADDQPLPKPLQFPSPPTQPEPWMRAPLTRLLPNFWTLLGYKNGQLIVNVKGGPIRDPLATGPDPSPTAKLDETGIDTGIKWMVDFKAAEEAGMGIRVKLSKEQATAGFDFLLVLGIRDFPVDSKDPGTRLAEQFIAHHYTNGLSFILPGTPSNNTLDAPSGFSSEDPGYEASYEAERIPQAFRPGDGSNFDTLSTALGLNVDAGFAQLAHTTTKDQLDARQMNTALWQATWGYFLLHMLGDPQRGESPLLDEDIVWARSHFIDYVRANGPLPALRIGKQPYGVLPVTSLDLWKSPAGRDNEFTRDRALQRFLIALRKVWRGNFSEVPRLGRTDDIDQDKGIDKDLIEVLHMDGLSLNYSLRNLMGRHYLEHLWIFLGSDALKKAWTLTEPEIEDVGPEPEPLTPDDFVGLSPQARAQLIKQKRDEVKAFEQRQRQAAAAVAAARARNEAIRKGNRDAVSAWWATQERLTTAVLNTLEVGWRPRLSRAVFAPPVATLGGPLVQADGSASLSPNYIEQLLAARDLIKEAPFVNQLKQPPPHTLLHLLLRHSMLLEYTNALTRLAIGRPFPAEARREPELIGLPEGQTVQTATQRLGMKLNVVGRGLVNVGEFLLPASGDPDVAKDPSLKQVKEFRDSLQHLKALSVEQLERLMRGTLDLCSHRLDAWITSFATKRLADMRKNSSTGVLFGGYGWVMNLKPAEAQTKVAVAGESEPVIQLENNPGFTHAPSLTHASTAAILRSAHLTHAAQGKQTSNDLLAIDLSSERVRLATWLLDGVRQGQPLGALLGYRFERRLQEVTLAEPQVNLAQFIFPFRELAPLVARKLDHGASSGPVETIAANNVVDGLALLRRWQKARSTTPAQWLDETIPFGKQVGQQPIKLPPPGDAKFERLQTELAVLADSVDAVSDALMAEGMYQIVRGNPLRAGTTVESIAGGETPVPELDVVRTPRSGIAITHRLLTLFSGKAVLPSEWASSKDSLRGNAEPHLNVWAAKLLGNPAHVRCLVERLEPETGKFLESKDFFLKDLGLAPLDLVYAIEADGQQGEIEQRIVYAITRKQDGFAAGSLLRVSRDRKPEWNASELSYGEFSELLRTVRKLLAGVRAIDDHDLNLPERKVDTSVEISELDERAVKAAAALNDTLKELTKLLATPDTANLERLRELILVSASFGIAGAVPVSAAGDSPSDREVLLIQAGSIEKELAQRSKQLETSNGAGATAAIARLRTVFGKAFVVLPTFLTTNGELRNALAGSTKIQDGDPFAAITWFQRMARVRDGVSRLNAALTYSEILKTGEKLKLNIAQLPFSSTDRWVGLPLKDNQTMPAGKLSLVVQSTAPIEVGQPLAGVLIDEWVEIVPSTTEITGLAFQYDQPNSSPPQTILLAVPPEIGSPWTIWSLQQVLLETLDLARIRAVDSEALDEVNHYLPALYFACNVAGDTVSTDFNTIK